MAARVVTKIAQTWTQQSLKNPWLKLIQLCARMFLVWNHFDILQVYIPRWGLSAITKNSAKHENDNINGFWSNLCRNDSCIGFFKIKKNRLHLLLKIAKCDTEKSSMELFQLFVTIIFAWSNFEFWKFCVPRWLPSAVTKNSTKHENGNISIPVTTLWILRGILKWHHMSLSPSVHPLQIVCQP